MQCLYSKRAFAVQFNWVFVLIAGGLIMLFFFTVIRGCQQQGEEAIDAQVTIDLSSVISSAEKSKGTLFKVDIKDTKLTYSCPYLSVGETAGTIRLDTAFSPDELKSVQDKYFMMSLDWNMPFKILNYFYLSSPEVRYVFLEDEKEYYNYILNDAYHYTFPQNMTPETAQSCAGLADVGDYKVRFIFFGSVNNDCTSGFSELERDDLTALNISVLGEGLDGDPLGGYGKVFFWHYNKQNSEFHKVGEGAYLGRTMLMGAIISEDPQSYNCAVRNSLKRLNVLSTVYLNRTQGLIDDLSVQGCFDKSGYVNSVTELKNIKSLTDDLNTLNTLNEIKMQQIFRSAKRIKEYNTQTLHASCPLIY